MSNYHLVTLLILGWEVEGHILIEVVEDATGLLAVAARRCHIDWCLRHDRAHLLLKPGVRREATVEGTDLQLRAAEEGVDMAESRAASNLLVIVLAGAHVKPILHLVVGQARKGRHVVADWAICCFCPQGSVFALRASLFGLRPTQR